MRRFWMSSLLIAGSMLGWDRAHATEFQEGRFKRCVASSTCQLEFAGPSAGRQLRVQYMTCKLTGPYHLNQNATQFELLDGNAAVFVSGEHQTGERQTSQFVASARINNVLFAGSNIRVRTVINGHADLQLACTISGEIL